MLKLFKENTLAYVAAGVSLLLQLISFLTTYQGADYYFRGIFILAPLFFAVAVQVVVYFLENSLRGSMHTAKLVALTLAICCSSYFSYIGIYNNVNSPLTYYQETYTNYSNTLQAKYDALLAKSDKKAQQQLNQVTTSLATVMVGWNTKKEELKSVEEELNKVGTSNMTTMSAPVRSSYRNYEDYAKAYQAYVSANSSSDATRVKKSTSSILKKYGYSDRQQVVEEIATLNGKSKNAKQSVKQLCQSLGVSASGEVAADLEAIRGKIAESMEAGEKNGKVDQSIYQLVSLYDQYVDDGKVNADILTQCIRLHQTYKEQLLADYSDVSAKEPSVCKSNLQWEISNAITEINRIYAVIDSEKTMDTEEFVLEDVYVLPLIRLVQDDTRKMAILCLIIAILTDGLSLFFALLFRPEKHVTELRTMKELLDREEPLFEKNVSAALELSMEQEQLASEQEPTELAERVKMRLTEFLRHFHTSTGPLKRGYSLQTTFEEVAEYQVLVALLCQLKQARILKDGKALKEYGDIPEDATVQLKTGFLLWCNEW